MSMDLGTLTELNSLYRRITITDVARLYTRLNADLDASLWSSLGLSYWSTLNATVR